MIIYEDIHNSLESATLMDKDDPLREFRGKFQLPQFKGKTLYFAGHSLGPMPKNAEHYLAEELLNWSKLGVEGHFKSRNPWYSYHELLTGMMAKIVGGLNSEVVVMNTLTVNLHLMMISFYRPSKKKFKILIENNSFPSDKYAVDSQARFHGHDPKLAVIELTPSEPGKLTISDQEVLDTIEKNRDELALILLGNVNYLSGQCFDFKSIAQKAHEYEIPIGFNLAHGAGNLSLELHKWGVDFAVWCTYKYLNSGPGGLAGCFVHEKHLGNKSIPRFEGWWGHNKINRFKMEPQFVPMDTAEAWQLSNPPIFPLTSLLASLEIFDQAGMGKIIEKGRKLTSYLEFLLKKNGGDFFEIITPSTNGNSPGRGSMLSVRLKNKNGKEVKKFMERVREDGIICDFREPDILRITPAPLYNTYGEVFGLVDIFKSNLKS